MSEERRETIVPKPNNLSYVIAVVIMMGFGVMGIVAITLARPEADNTALIGAILGFLAPTTLSLLAFMKSQETHLSVNSRLDAFMSNAKLASRAQGLAEGRMEGRSDANARTDALADKLVNIGLIPPIPSVLVVPPVTNVLTDIKKDTKETVETLKEIKSDLIK